MGNAWSGSAGNVTNNDSNYVICTAYTAPVTGIPCPILRLTFPPFSLPVTDTIVSATLTGFHLNGVTPNDAGYAIIDEYDSSSLPSSNTAFTHVLSPSSFTIASLNAGTATVDYLVHGQGNAVAIMNFLPVPWFNQGILNIQTMAPPTGGMLDNVPIILASQSIKVF